MSYRARRGRHLGIPWTDGNISTSYGSVDVHTVHNVSRRLRGAGGFETPSLSILVLYQYIEVLLDEFHRKEPCGTVL